MAEARTLQPDGHLHGVIVACERDGKWLLIRRSEQVAAPLRICFPGGGIDADESQRDAVVREMLEELDASVTPLRCCWKTVYAERRITLWGWHADLHSDALTAAPEEVAEILWMSEAEIRESEEVLPGTTDFLDAIARGDELAS